MIAQAPPSNATEWTVSELAGALKRTLEDSFGHVRLRGEISSFRGRHSSGHCYFCLKDENARVEAVIWKTAYNRLKFKPEEGLEVIATGRITTFPGKSTYQIVVENLEPAGVGALMALLEERKRKLAAEGLFEAGRKRRLPFLPATIGVVTSPTGSVIRDILHRLADRFPRRVLVWPVRVQGETCAAEVAAAIRGFNALPVGGPVPRPDVLIVARGGGSLEDLWGFNEEIVVRAAAESAIPLVSAIGHETDTTLIDHAADLRAPTPTGAAEMVVPVRAELVSTIHDLARRHGEAVIRSFERRRVELRSAARALPTPDGLLAGKRQLLDLASAKLKPALRHNARDHESRLARASHALLRLSPAARLGALRTRYQAIDDRPRRGLERLVADRRKHLGQAGERLLAARDGFLRAERVRIGQCREAAERVHERLAPALAAQVERKRARVVAVAKLFDSLNYKSVLARGYALVRDSAGAPVRRAAEVGAGQPLAVEFADGTVDVTAQGSEPEHTAAVTPPRRPARRQPAPTAAQATLFDA